MPSFFLRLMNFKSQANRSRTQLRSSNGARSFTFFKTCRLDLQVTPRRSTKSSRRMPNKPSDSTKALGPGESSVSNKRSLRPHLPHHRIPRTPEVQKSDIVWSGVASISTKHLTHYPAFVKNGASIAVHSFVFIMAEGESHYVGYLEDLYENRKGQKMVKVRWFHQSHEVRGIISNLNPHPREIFKTRDVQVISAECIDGPAMVLTPKHYEKYLATVSHDTSGILMCFRQFKNNTVQPFSLSKLQGYWNQPILASLDSPCVSNSKVGGLKSNRKDVELISDDSQRRGLKRNMISRETERLEAASDGRTSSNAGSTKENCDLYKKVKLMSSDRVSDNIEDVGSPVCGHAYKVGDNVEILSQDSGLRGCWFRCKVLKTSQKSLKVQYVDVEDADEPGNLEEWVRAARVAAPDKLGIRCQGRHTVRPWPPHAPLDHPAKFGSIVDAWWCEGWWESVVIEGDSSGNESIKVYIPGEDLVVTVLKKDARVSRDWINGTWVELKATSDELARIPSSARPDMNLSVDSEALTIEEKVGIMMQAMESNEASSVKDGNTGDEVEPAPESENPEL